MGCNCKKTCKWSGIPYGEPTRCESKGCTFVPNFQDLHNGTKEIKCHLPIYGSWIGGVQNITKIDVDYEQAISDEWFRLDTTCEVICKDGFKNLSEPAICKFNPRDLNNGKRGYEWEAEEQTCVPDV